MAVVVNKTFEDRKKLVLEHAIIYPKSVPLIIQHQPEGEVEYNKGYTQGWTDYLEKAKTVLNELTEYKQIIPFANIPQPTDATYKGIHYSVGYTMGWRNFRMFMKKIFFS